MKPVDLILALVGAAVVLLAVSGCTVVSDHGFASMGDARKIDYTSARGARFRAEELNHSKAVGEVTGGVKHAVTGGVVKALGGDLIREGADIADKALD